MKHSPCPAHKRRVATTSAHLAKPCDSHGKTITEDVVEVSWSASGKDSALPEAWYDKFVLRGSTPTEVGPVWFKVLQTCENASAAHVH